MSNPHETAAIETLRNSARECFGPLIDTQAALKQAAKAMRTQTDIVQLMVVVNELVMAAEAIALNAKAIAETADAAIVAAMLETGCTQISTEHHTVSLRDPIPSVQILDEAAVPPGFMRQPAPSPDKRAIAKALKADGAAINWAVLKPGKHGLTRRSNAS